MAAFTIQLRFIGPPVSASRQALFENAADQWSQIITEDIPNLSVVLPAGSCLDQSPAANQVVDDLLIDISLIEIDGAGGTLGQAGPCVVRSDTLLPVYGGMEFDQADVASLEEDGLFDRVILHEMGHVLGIGTTWLDNEFLVGILSLNPQYVGEQGVAQFQALGGSGSVPVENRGGIGTRADHWRESVFQSELMTGALNADVFNPLSRLTIGSLVDLGYAVDFNQAEPYALPAQVASSARLLPLREGLLSTPLILMDRRGQPTQRLPR